VNDALVQWLGLDRNSILGRDSVELGMWVILDARAKFWADLERSNGSLREFLLGFQESVYASDSLLFHRIHGARAIKDKADFA
jgi:hypothetical protein